MKVVCEDEVLDIPQVNQFLLCCIRLCNYEACAHAGTKQLVLFHCNIPPLCQMQEEINVRVSTSIGPSTRIILLHWWRL